MNAIALYLLPGTLSLLYGRAIGLFKVLWLFLLSPAIIWYMIAGDVVNPQKAGVVV
jgi:hypothetical protein